MPQTQERTRYRIEELANRSQLSVDTIRYYQNLKLLEPPVKDGRIGWYGNSHLKRLQQVQNLSENGFTLEQIRELDNHNPLLRVLAAKTHTAKTYTPAELAYSCGLELSLVEAAIEVGLIQPLANSRPPKFSSDAAEMLLAAAALIEAGIDAGGLLELAMEHASHTQASVEKAIGLFVDATKHNELSKDEVAQQLEHLLPLVAQLVARHFNQTLLAHSAKLIHDRAGS